MLECRKINVTMKWKYTATTHGFDRFYEPNHWDLHPIQYTPSNMNIENKSKLIHFILYSYKGDNKIFVLFPHHLVALTTNLLHLAVRSMMINCDERI